MINFIIPGMYEQYNKNFCLLLLLKHCPYYFYDNVNIGAVYGNFQYCIFDGGRNFFGYKQTTKEEIENVKNIYNNDFNVPIRLIFTNNQLEPKHYNNRFGNIVLELCENDMNENTIGDDNFKQYIHENYPKYSFISSTTKCITNLELANEELKRADYKMVCLDYNLNHNMKFLESLDKDIRSKVELLTNAICPSGCPNRKKHYKLNSLFSLTYGKSYNIPECGIRFSTVNPISRKYPNTISPEEIYQIYAPMGFNLMKIEGRTFGQLELALNYIHYMIKPEYQHSALNFLVQDGQGIQKNMYNNSLEQYQNDIKSIERIQSLEKSVIKGEPTL